MHDTQTNASDSEDMPEHAGVIVVDENDGEFEIFAEDSTSKYFANMP
jgi:hypothetical protein